MRYVADLVRGMEVNRALATLHFSKKAASVDLEKLLRSAIANWEVKNDRKADEGELFVTKILWMKVPRSSVCVPHPRDAATESVSVQITSPFSLTQRTNDLKVKEWDKKLIR